jgi:hypothetical protein
VRTLRGVDAIVELAFRSSCDIDVSLLWDRERNVLSVQVIDWRTDDDFTIAVAPDRALEVFEHPYAYAPGGYGELVVK